MGESNRVYMEIDKLPTLAFLLLCVIFFFSTSASVSKHHNLLLSLIAVAKSSRVAVFFVFNIINIAVFLWSFKPYAVDFEGFFALPLVYEMDAAEAASDEDYFWDSDDHDEEDHGYGGYDEDDDDDDEGSEEDEIDSEDENEDDLEQRIEEFIAKVNRKWREEVLAEKLLCMAATDELQYFSSSN